MDILSQYEEDNRISITIKAFTSCWSYLRSVYLSIREVSHIRTLSNQNSHIRTLADTNSWKVNCFVGI